MPDKTAESLVTLTIDGVQLQVPKGTLLVEAAKQIRREIPVYCYHTKMGPAGLCRICLVEIEGMPKLQIGCNTPVTDGMVAHTQSPKAADGRRAVLELYLKNHPLDCPICDKGGECDLQDYAMAYGQGYSRSADPKIAKPKAVDLGPTIVLDEERCVVCQRCVRFDDIIVGDRQLVLKDRGVHDIIATATDEPYRHNFTGNVTELCPVGALTSKTYRFKSRPWDLRRTTTSCLQCAVGCQMHVDARVGSVMRTMSVQSDDAISDTWLCDRGRYNVGFYESIERITQPLYKKDGRWTAIGWDDAIAFCATAIREAVSANPNTVGVIGGGRLTNEEAFLLQHVFRSVNVRNLDWRAGRQRQATPGRNSGKLVDLESVDAVMLVGESPSERAPIMDLRVRKAAFQKGAKVIRIASRERPYPPPIPFVDVANVADAVAALPPNARRIAVVWDGIDLPAANALLSALDAQLDILTYITGEQPNARGAEAMGMLPHFGPGYTPVDEGMDTSAMFGAAHDGAMAVLCIVGANPALHFPDAAYVREAIAKVPFVVVSDLFMTQTAELATLVLPARGPFEKIGTTTNLAGDVLSVNAAVSLQTPPGTLTDFEMLLALADRLGVQTPPVEELVASVMAHSAGAAQTFGMGDERFARVVLVQSQSDEPQSTDDAGEDFEVLPETRIFAGGGTSAHDDRIAELRPLPQAALSPNDAQRLGLANGTYIDLSIGENGTVMHDLLVEIRPNLADGIVVLIDGLPDDPANISAEHRRARVRNARNLEKAAAR